MDLSAIAAGGLDVAQSRFEKAATGIASAFDAAGTPATTPADTVSLSRQTVALLSARNEFSANLKVAHVADEMQKTLLNILA